MNELRDPSVERLYGEASREQPGAAADAAILALAREAAAQAAAHKPAGGAHWSRRWHRPLALAASVVLVVGMVSRIGLEPPNGADSAPASAPVVAAASDIAGTANQTADMAPARTRASEMARKQERSGVPAVSADAPQSRAQSAPPSPAPVTAKAEVPYPEAATTAETGPRPFAAPSPPVGGSVRESARDSVRGPDLASSAAGGAAAGASASGDMRRDAAPAAAMKPAQRAARENAGAAVQDAARIAAALPVLSESQEAALAPENWLTYILDLRRQGQHDAADTSLKRFRFRFPAYPVPPQAATPGAPGSGEAK